MEGLTLRRERPRRSCNGSIEGPYTIKFRAAARRGCCGIYSTGSRLPWQRAAAGLLALSVLWNVVQSVRINHLEIARMEATAQLVQAEAARDYAIEQMGALALQAERDKQARVEQAAAYEAVGVYQYIGECAITAYCPCEECCGAWADGLTATGIPAERGIVAVDPEVIPLGSTVVIDGQKYLAADTGVTGQAVDVCLAGHDEAVAFGVQRLEVWVVAG